ncbi:hypothetical protein BN59_03618 [Legionella massiliensis]|uniref:Uncharacterized protein n=1 Tax=Legionella massiliensis TaxID=1034943 RepID=A0A078KY09_9GAMM|nr:hypothetical protein [Legionella massiliensis]CDZ79300.1 hypothetical protein BN59_03618 [Legionella massiliensis]CEE15038.1 hypothetical protein BN1094_03618 [Legionella massiliensis]
MVFFRQIICTSILLLSFGVIQTTKAEETDQFTLPPTPLVDIGPTASHKLAGILEKVMDQTNGEIQALLPKAQTSRHAATQLAERRRDAYLIELIYKEVGIGLPVSTFERWLQRGSFPQNLQPMRYAAIWPWKTVYWMVISQFPGTLFLLSPTINMYGHYFGTDKVGHFFQQGRGYYKNYMWLLAQGKSAAQARAAIISRGQNQESGLYGTMINGIFSNADLSANYAGWKFYMNLTHTVKIGGKSYPPILVLKGDKWEFAPYIDKDNLLKPYVNDNLNEALNPAHYFFLRSVIRRNIKKRCAEWIQRNKITHETVQIKLAETSQWRGENYGHWLPAKDAVTLDSCFGGK